jgi:1,4-alpha-glucan branching enzyme
MMAHPGKKLLFMGQEFGQFIEWNEEKQLDWLLLGYERHAQMQSFVRTLNAFYKETPALWEDDFTWDGFQWIVPDDSSQNVIAFMRRDRKGNEIIAVCNFAPVTRENYCFGVPRAGVYKELLNSDDTAFGGTGIANAPMRTTKGAMHGFDQYISLRIPALSTVFLKVPGKKKPATAGAKPQGDAAAPRAKRGRPKKNV